jgi:3-oxoacyl-(acyl-carrier-protein) synthase
MLRRVVITGVGVIAPNGIGKEDFWQASIAGRSGIGRITRFDASALTTRIAGEVDHFDPYALGISPQEVLNLDRGTQFALAAANLALQDAKVPGELSEIERERFGVYLGSAMAGSEEGEKLLLQLVNGVMPSAEDSWREPTANEQWPTAPLHNGLMPASVIAAHHRLHGPCMVISTGCSAGADAIGEAFWAIQEGRADRMLAGGCDSAITYAGINVFSIMKALSTRNEAPERASRPYDEHRDGFVMAEGAGVLLLEERARALARGARIYAEVITFTSNSNAYHMTTLPDDGAPLQHLLRQALLDAQITSEQLDYINPHGSSTLYNEVAETTAYKAVFGKRAYHIPISATKSMIGHTQGAASAIETIVTALVVERQIIPPTINQEYLDPRCDLDYVPNVARQATVNVALTHSSGFGGVNSALILTKPNWGNRHGR